MKSCKTAEPPINKGIAGILKTSRNGYFANSCKINRLSGRAYSRSRKHRKTTGQPQKEPPKGRGWGLNRKAEVSPGEPPNHPRKQKGYSEKDISKKEIT